MTRSIDYVLPLRWTVEGREGELEDLTAYLEDLSVWARVIVVDGSPASLFERHHAMWGAFVSHVPPDPSPWRNGKVGGVHTGLRLATADAVIIADDDVRYDPVALRRTVELLDEADLVGPQNVFHPTPWHAGWDSARSLLNRAVSADYPGTFAVRRSTFVDMGGYDGDVLFENLELMRTVRANGGRVLRPRDIYVTRRPPSARHFLGQRVRQAYDDIAQPWRLALFLPVLPTALSGRRGRRVVAAALAASVGLAEIGRRRGGGADHFAAYVSLLAPGWVLERSVCSWLAVTQAALAGGVRYGDVRLAVAAHSARQLRRAAARRRALIATRGTERALVRAVAERLESGTAAPAERHRAPTRHDFSSVRVHDGEAAPQQQRPIRVGDDLSTDRGRARSGLVALDSHGRDAAPAADSETRRPRG